MKDLVLDITGIFGPSGDEELIRNFISELVSEYADEIKTDALGNLIVHKKGPGKKIMLAAHMDQIGLMATAVEESGYVRFAPIGGVSPSTLVNQKVVFKNGVIGVVSMEGKDCTASGPISKFFIDIGTGSREETEELISPGDNCIFYAPAVELANDIISSPYLDNRVSCAVLIDVLRSLKALQYDAYFVFTTQEEVGLRGAKAAAFGIMPDLGIAIDVTGTGDIINPAHIMSVKLGAGPTVKIKDASVICSPMVRRLLEQTAEKHQIPYQPEILEYGGTDTASIQLTGAGIPAGCISIPTRYIHSMSETCSMSDVENAARLLTALLEEGT